jgi:hypothetical protein
MPIGVIEGSTENATACARSTRNHCRGPCFAGPTAQASRSLR